MKRSERKAEELMKIYAEELMNCREVMFDQIKDAPEECSERKQIIVKKNNMLKNVSRACVIVLCCIVLFTGFFTVTTEANLAQLFSFVFEKHDDNIEVTPEKDPIAPVAVYPDYLPKGYEFVSETEIAGGVEIMYVNNKTDEALCIIQMKDSTSYSSVDTETTASESCFVNGSQAYFYEMDGMNALVWEEDDTYIEITSSLEKEVLIKIANSFE